MNKDELQKEILQIEESLAQMESQLQDFPNLTDSEKSQLIQRMESLKVQFEKKISSLEKNIIQLNDSSIEPSAIEDLEEKLEEIVKVLKQRASEHYDVDYNKGIETKNDQNQQMLAEGQDLFNEGMELANNMLKNLKEANAMMIDIESEIYEQRMKLIRTKDTLKEAQNLTNRTKELVGYFSNQMAKDKCFKIMIGIMAVLLVGCIIMLYFYRDQIGIESQIEKQEIVNSNKEFQMDENGKITLNVDGLEDFQQNFFSDIGKSSQQRKADKINQEYMQKQKDQQSKNQVQQPQETNIENQVQQKQEVNSQKKVRRSRKLISKKMKRKNKKNFQGFTKEDMDSLNFFQQYLSFDPTKEEKPLI